MYVTETGEQAQTLFQLAEIIAKSFYRQHKTEINIESIVFETKNSEIVVTNEIVSAVEKQAQSYLDSLEENAREDVVYNTECSTLIYERL